MKELYDALIGQEPTSTMSDLIGRSSSCMSEYGLSGYGELTVNTDQMWLAFVMACDSHFGETLLGDRQTYGQFVGLMETAKMNFNRLFQASPEEVRIKDAIIGANIEPLF